MKSRQKILSENKEYWTGRAAGYSKVNQEELAAAQRQKWSACLSDAIAQHFPDRPPHTLHVLDVGTGPGFFSILLCEMGYKVTAVDLTPAMLAEAKKNAGELADQISWLEMNAEDLRFENDSFDIVVSRNLTWNLPHPDAAYAEWVRVLRTPGLILNFDANWYAYLFSDEARAAYEQDRINSAAQGVNDQNIGENFDIMEDIARRVPLSRISRPDWDLNQLRSLGMQAEADLTVWQKVWSEEEKLNFSSTPQFLVSAGKTR